MSNQLLDLVGDPTRRSILELLRRRPRSVAALADELPVSRPAVSKHLKLMLEAGLVGVTQRGTRRIYRIRPETFGEIVRYWDGFWTGVLDEFKRHAENEEERMTEKTGLVVRKEIVVERSRDDAFRIFTTEMAQWWPTATHSIHGDAVTDVLFETHVDGRIAEVTTDGAIVEWGRVLEWDAPGGFTVSWKPNLDAGAHRSTWVICFESIGDEITRIELVHSGFEGFDDPDAIRAQYEPGWDLVLGRFVSHIS